MNINMKCLLAAAGLSELFSGFSASCMTAEAMNTSEKLEEQISALKKETDNLKNELFELRKEEQCKLSANLFENEEDLHDVSMEFVDDSIGDCNNNIGRLSSDDKDLLWYKTLLKYLEREKEIIGKIEKFEKEITNRHVALEYLLSKDKWQITNDFMMIIGKYFKNNEDYINVMKVNPKYEQLVLMYKFNPISDISLFENIQTQHFYNEKDVNNNKKDGMYQYIYWFPQCNGDRFYKNKKNNEIFKRFIAYPDEASRYQEIAAKYGIVPSDLWLFANDQVQHLWQVEDEKTEGKNLYVHWGEYDCNSIKHKNDNEIFKNLFIIRDWNSKKYPLPIVEGNCIVPEEIRKIGSDCFDGSALTKITLPSRLIEIGTSAFESTNIRSIIIPEGVTRIGYRSFYYCSFLTNIALPSTLREIGVSAFRDTKITSVIIPEGITKISASCFQDCYQLTNIKLPSTLTEIGADSFLQSMNKSGGQIVDIKLPISVKNIENSAFLGVKITSIIIPEGVTRIKYDCFFGCSLLTDIILPSTLKVIEDEAFLKTKITSIIIPEGVTSIGYRCFYDCNQLTDIKLPSTLNNVGFFAFKGTKIKHIVVPDGVKYDRRKAWEKDPSFKKINDREEIDGILFTNKNDNVEMKKQKNNDDQIDISPDLLKALNGINGNVLPSSNISEVVQPNQKTTTTLERKKTYENIWNKNVHFDSEDDNIDLSSGDYIDSSGYDDISED